MKCFLIYCACLLLLRIQHHPAETAPMKSNNEDLASGLIYLTKSWKNFTANEQKQSSALTTIKSHHHNQHHKHHKGRKKEIFNLPASTTCINDGIVYKNGQKIPRGDPCEICFCMATKIFCWWKICNNGKMKGKSHETDGKKFHINKSETTMKTHRRRKLNRPYFPLQVSTIHVNDKNVEKDENDNKFKGFYLNNDEEEKKHFSAKSRTEGNYKKTIYDQHRDREELLLGDHGKLLPNVQKNSRKNLSSDYDQMEALASENVQSKLRRNDFRYREFNKFPTKNNHNINTTATVKENHTEFSTEFISEVTTSLQNENITSTYVSENCVVMGISYRIGEILPQETGNCLQCICIEGTNKGDSPRVTCNPHNCPPLVLPDLFDNMDFKK